ncbi:DUF4145 domain-containing protein [Stenotrophomonas maltophilia]|uniref:DUF4145 domain-containing protein n=1 Tax=Stenotrophomonas maltophilia TaxID=40324 RepID=UPI000C148B6C|nr:DUF4145 domain-containing protein [Stenotrophomonas maltophilia]
MAWQNLSQLQSCRFTCGHCGYSVANDRGYYSSGDNGRIYICPSCEKPTCFDYQGMQTPGVAYGNQVDYLPDSVNQLYREARNCCSAAAYTSCVLACRKILMNIAVEQGAKEGLTFAAYIDFLARSGFIPPNGRGWVDHIRKRGNEATHEIALMSKSDAQELVSFVEMLLKFIFEFPARVPGT